MKRKLQTLVISVAYGLTLIAALGVTAAAAPPQNAPERTQPSNILDVPPRRETTALVRVQFPDPTVALNHYAVQVMLNASGVSGRAAQELLGITAEQAKSAVFVEFAQPLGGEYSLSESDAGVRLLGVMTMWVDEAACPTGEKAEALLRRTAELLAAALPGSATPDRAALEADLAEVAREQQRVEAELARIAEQREEQLKQSSELELTDWDRIRTTITRLQDQQAALELERIGQEARRQALMEQIARVRQEVETAVTADETLRELERVVTLREERMEAATKLAQHNAMSDSELRQMQEAVALARAEVARRRQQAADAVGAGLLAKLNDELVMGAVQGHETQARLRHTGEQLAQFVAARERATRFEKDVLTPQMMLAEESNMLDARREELELRIGRPPQKARVEVLGQAAEESEKKP